MTDKATFRGFMLSSGELISIKKASDQKLYPDSNVLPTDEFGELYNTGKTSKPPYNPEQLATFLENNTYHYRCVKQKASDVVGLGWDFENDGEEIEDKKNNPTYKKIVNFFNNCNPNMTFNEIMEQSWIDYESIGWLVIEVLRTKGGAKEVVRLEHIPAKTCRYSLSPDLPGIIQKRGLNERYFKFFGDTEERIDPNTGLPASEVFYMINYHPKSDFYGIPDFIPAIGAIVASLEIRDYNIEFFDNNAIPDYAIILEGGEPDDTFEKTVKDYFLNNLKGKGKHHRTLVVSAPEGGKITFQPLSVDVKDGHYRLYRLDCRDEIIHAHGVPPYRIGINETGSLSGTTAVEASKIYKYSIIEPRQEKIENRLTKIIELGLNVKNWKFKYNDIDLEDKKLEADIEKIKAETAKVLIESNVKTPNEVRKEVLDVLTYGELDTAPQPVKDWADLPSVFGNSSLQSQQQGAQQEAMQSQQINQQSTQDNKILNDPAFNKAFEAQFAADMKAQGLTKNQIDIINKYYEDNGFTYKKKEISSIDITKSINKFVEDQDKLIESSKNSLHKYFNDTSKKVIGALETMDLGKVKVKKGLSNEESDQILAQYPDLREQLSAYMTPNDLGALIFALMSDGVDLGLESALRELGDSQNLIDFKLYDKKVTDFLNGYVFKASKITMDRLIGDVIHEIKMGQELGESIPQIQARLETVFIGMRDFETERIARTEVNKSSNWARFQSFKDAGKELKQWKSNIDGRTRDSHIGINGQIKGIDEKFSNGLLYPGDPAGSAREVVNCRCTIVFVNK